jgi:uncharacterized protein (UPF0332 family)
MKLEAAKLLDKAEHAIRAATLLLDAGETDFAAGRAYYAMFYVAEALLSEQGLSFSKHTGVHGAFGEHFAKTGRLDPKFHRWLLDAFDYRITGDYDTAPSTPPEVVKTLLAQAKEFLSEAHRFIAAGPTSHST